MEGLEEKEEGLEELLFSPFSSVPEKGLKGTKEEEGEEEKEVVGEEELSLVIRAGNSLDTRVFLKDTFGGCEGPTTFLITSPSHRTMPKGLPVGRVLLDTGGASPRVGHPLLLPFNILPT